MTGHITRAKRFARRLLMHKLCVRLFALGVCTLQGLGEARKHQKVETLAKKKSVFVVGFFIGTQLYTMCVLQCMYHVSMQGDFLSCRLSEYSLWCFLFWQELLLEPSFGEGKESSAHDAKNKEATLVRTHDRFDLFRLVVYPKLLSPKSFFFVIGTWALQTWCKRPGKENPKVKVMAGPNEFH